MCYHATVKNAFYLRTTVDQLSGTDFNFYKKYLADIEPMDKDYDKYHYARVSIWGKYCYYFIIVERSTNMPAGWGFDRHLADPTKTCGTAG